MALDRTKDTSNANNETKHQSCDNIRGRMRKEKAFQTKVVIRRLPPSMTEEQFLMQIAPVPDHDYFQFVKADLRLGHNAVSRAYLNFTSSEELFVFKDKFDNYVFLDNKGNEYPAVVEFAQFQKIPRKRNKKKDPKCATIESDPDYISFLENLKNPDAVSMPTAEVYLEEIETREKELKANNGVLKMTTPLIEYIKQRKIEQQRIREEKREERKRRELERKRLREEERRRRKTERDKLKEKLLKEKESSLSEKESYDEAMPDATQSVEDTKQPEPVVKVLKNTARDEEVEMFNAFREKFALGPPKDKGKFKKDSDYEANTKTKERLAPKEKPRVTERVVISRDRGRRTDKTEYKSSYASSYKSSQSSSGSHSTTFYPSNKRGVVVDDCKKGKMATTEKSPPKTKKDRIFYSNVKKSDASNLTTKDTASSSKVTSGDLSEAFRNEDTSKDNSKDPRTERRIRNKDRPTMEIYRPGMRRIGTQRNSPQKEVSTSNSNSSSPSPTPPLCTSATSAGTIITQSDLHELEKSIPAFKTD